MLLLGCFGKNDQVRVIDIKGYISVKFTNACALEGLVEQILGVKGIRDLRGTIGCLY